MTTNDLLKQGIAALNAGRKAEARSLLMRVVQQDKRNEMGWLWLSGAVDTDDDRRICLENVLATNPNNGIARRGLESLVAKEGVRSLGAVSPSRPNVESTTSPREQPTQSPAESNASGAIRHKERSKTPKRGKMTKQQTGLLIGLGAGVLVLICIAFAGIWWVTNNEFPHLEPVAPISLGTTQVSSTTDATPTVIPSSTRISTWTPTPRPTHTPRPRSTPAPRFGSPESPVPFGQMFLLQQNDVVDFEIAIRDAYRGDRAWQILYAENQFNAPPPAGMEYVRVYVEVKCLKGSSSDPLHMTRWDFSLLSKGRVFQPAILVEPEPTFDDVVLVSGGLAKGWMSFLTHADDPVPLLVLGMDNSEEGGFYFVVESSTKPTSVLTPTPAFGTFASPAPIGVTVTRSDELANEYQMSVTVLEVYRGAEADRLFKSQSTWYKAPIAGQEYVAVRVRLEMFNGSPNKVFKIIPYTDLTIRYEPSGADIWLTNIDIGNEGYLPLREDFWIFYLIREGSEPLLYFQPKLAAYEQLGHRTSGAFLALTQP